MPESADWLELHWKDDAERLARYAGRPMEDLLRDLASDWAKIAAELNLPVAEPPVRTEPTGDLRPERSFPVT